MTILEYIKKHNYHTRVLFFMVGLFVAAMSYNLFIEPNNLLVGGLSGLGLIGGLYG